MRTSRLLLLPFLLLNICHAQQPVLKVGGKDSARVQLKNYTVNVKVVGNTAVTTMEMQFCNSAPRVLEGELTFPMPEGVSISRYAIDINGKMREAVPVEKEKGQVVFENIERRNVDPGLLEKTEGNNFRTRIYPIPANGCRRVLIAYEQELKMADRTALSYSLPLHFKNAIPVFKIDFKVFSSAIPEVGSACNTDMKFENQNEVWSSSVNKTNFKPDGNFNIIIPKLENAAETIMKQSGSTYYFLINTFPEVKKTDKAIPGNIGLVWDVSLSGLNRDHSKEFSLLDEYFKKKGNLQVSVSFLGYDFVKGNTYTINGGNWSELKKDLEKIVYDGATNLGNLKNIQPADEYLFFTDGLHTYGNFDYNLLPTKPVYPICASANANYNLLKFIAAKTGGAFINLNEQTPFAALSLLTQQQLQFLGIKPNNSINELYPAVATPVTGNLAVAGICSQPATTVTLLFGYGTTIVMEKSIEINAAKQQSSFIDIEKIWAQKKINNLEMLQEENKAAITSLGKKYGIVTANTSLIVLDDVADYVKYEIEPPAELKAEYTKLISDKKRETAKIDREAISKAVTNYGELKKWWEKEFNEPIKQKPQVTTASRNEAATRPSFISDSSIISANRIIQGKITNSDGLAIAGASITSGRFGTSTDANGNYYFSMNNSSSSLSINSVGYNSLSFNATGGRKYNIVLTPTSQPLTEVVITSAAGIRRTQRSVSSNVQKVDDEQVIGGTTHYMFSTTASDSAVYKMAVTSGVGAYSQGLSNSNGLNVNTTAVPITRIPPTPRSGSMSDSVRYRGELASDISNGRFDTIMNLVDFDDEIKTEERIPVRPYLKSLDSASTKDLYAKYLELRKENIADPVFYFDVAKRYFKNGEKTIGLKILSNVADLNFDDHELYKLLGYQLMALQEYEEAVNTFRKVLQWRPQEPQSYRDYGLALTAAGKFQHALDTLYLSLTKNFDAEISELYPGIEEITVTEINNLIALHGNNLNLAKIDRRIIKNLPVDVRVVLNWNFNDTDMDLWVTDPNGEKCFYSQKETEIGGHMSNDFTRGYGPEQFMLKKAIKGKYKVEVDYYGDTQQKLAGPTTVLAQVFTNYGRPNQTSKTIAIQMEPKDKGGVFIGEFEF